MKISKLFLTTILGATLILSCSKDEDIPIYNEVGRFDSGVLVLNQGSAASTLSFISFDLNTTINDIFTTTNPTVPFGKFGQDIGFINDKAYAVMGGVNAIQIFNRYTAVSLGKIDTELNNPRYIVFYNNKIYVTNHATFESLTDDYVAVYNQTTGAFITKIDVPGGSAEKMIVNNDKLYVAQGGAYGTGNKVVVINLLTNAIDKSIEVGDAPNSLQIANGFLWVMYGGNSNYFPVASVATAGGLAKIDLVTNTVSTNINFADASKFPTNFEFFSNKAYFTVGNDIYKMLPTATALPITKSFTADVVSMNAFAVKNNYIYVGDAPSFTNNGNVKIYANGDRTETTDGTTLAFPLGKLIKSTGVGVQPSGFYFNQ